MINIDCIVYTVIDEALIKIICEQLQIVSIFLFISRPFRDYNEQIVFKSIIHVIYFILQINGHAKQTCFMLIVSLNNHRIIISKSWINRHEVILNMLYNRIVFKSNRCNHLKTIFNHVSSKNNQHFILNRRSLIWTFMTFATSVIKEIFKYIILKKKSVLNQIIKESIVKSRSTFIVFETFTNVIEIA